MTETAECAGLAHSTFEDWLVRYQGQLYRYALHLTRDRTDADALYQETVLTAYRRFDQLDGRANHCAWLFRIETKAFLRKHRRRSKEGSLAEVSAEMVPAATEAPGLDARDLFREVEIFVPTLPVTQRLALIQRMYHDASYAEIAANLLCSEMAARASVYQALRTMRVHFDGQ